MNFAFELMEKIMKRSLLKPSHAIVYALGDVLRTSGRWLDALQLLEDVLSSCKVDAIVLSVASGAALKAFSKGLSSIRMSRPLLGVHP